MFLGFSLYVGAIRLLKDFTTHESKMMPLLWLWYTQSQSRAQDYGLWEEQSGRWSHCEEGQGGRACLQVARGTELSFRLKAVG